MCVEWLMGCRQSCYDIKSDKSGGVFAENTEMNRNQPQNAGAEETAENRIWKLSIVTVCYNARSCIQRTIVSVLAQTEPVCEYIVVDGASKDGTYELVCSYEEAFREKGIRFLHMSAPDKGISDAFNKGIAMATGELIGLIHADDELMPDTSRLLRLKCAEETADIYYGNCIWADTGRNREYVTKPKHDMSRLMYHMVLLHPSTFVTRAAYDRCGVYDTSYKLCMDEELLCRMYLNGCTFAYLDESLSRCRSGGISDRQCHAVLKEASRIPLGYGEPWLKVKCIESYKRFRNWAVQK